LIKFDVSLLVLSENEGWRSWFEGEFSTSWVDACAVFEAERAKHNSEMHAANGNGKLSGSMSEVKECGAYTSFYTTPISTSVVDPVEFAGEVASIASSITPIDSDIPSSMMLRGDVYTNANANVNGRQLQALESLLYPRQVRNAAGAVVDNTSSLAWIIIGLMDFKASTLTTTGMTDVIIRAATEAVQNIARMDNTTIQGFHAFDVASLVRATSYQGYSLQACIMKLVLYQTVLGWTASRNNLPISNEAGVFDPRAQIDPAGAIDLGYNDCPNATFTETLGGATAVFPWRGGVTSFVLFHLSLETVPSSERNQAVFMPASLFSASRDPRIAIFLFVMMWADWPSLMWTVNLPTLDATGGNAGNQFYIPHASTIFIPGYQTIHIILPRMDSYRNPRTQAEANTWTHYQPATGSVPTTAFPAPNTAIDINFKGRIAPSIVNLAEYAYSFGTDVNFSMITEFLQTLNDVVDIRDELDYCYHVASVLAVRYAPLGVQTRGTNNPLPVNSDMSNVQITPLGLTVVHLAAPGNLPQNAIPKPDFLMFRPDPLAWNKVALGLSSAEGRTVTGQPINHMATNAFFLYYMKVLARLYAVTTNVHRSLLGIPALMWNNMYDTTDMTLYRLIGRAHYCVPLAGTMQPRPAKWGTALAKLFTGLLGSSPAPDTAKNTVFDYVAPPRGLIEGPIDVALGVTYANVVPVWLPDIWIYVTVRAIPRGLASFPPHNTIDSTVGLGDTDFIAMRVGAADKQGTFLLKGTITSSIPQKHTRDDTDEEIWNARLFTVFQPQTEFVFLDGTRAPGTVLPGDFPKVLTNTADYTLPNRTQDDIATGSTFWIPRITTDGRPVYPADTRANTQQISQILARLSRASITFWAINGLQGISPRKMAVDTDYKSVWWSIIQSTGPPTKVSQGGDQPAKDTSASGAGEQMKSDGK
jgi:hypothetical protein